jgi:hypothetical protein
VAGGNSQVTSDELIDEAPRKFVSFAATLRVNLWRRVDIINYQHFHHCICWLKWFCNNAFGADRLVSTSKMLFRHATR